MTLLKAIFLGILQGATEFLPVSSSGHLFIAQRLLGLREPELAFDLLLHLGTLFAVLVFLRKEILEILGSLFRRE
ncbi:MAG: undecaprenyl-diphosphate phosphatase, partial [Candidatus Deferrimicrobiota bacterium]